MAITSDIFEVREGLCFIVQPYFDGVTLDNLIKPGQAMALTDFFTIACGLVFDAVHSVGIIHGGVKPHNILVTSDTLEIRLIDFISALDASDSSLLFISYGATEEVVKAKKSIQDVDLDLDKVIPVALIINELVSNALKHGYPDHASCKDGEIHVELRRVPDRRIRLTVSDNGVGFLKDFRWSTPRH